MQQLIVTNLLNLRSTSLLIYASLTATYCVVHIAVFEQ
jgi:hypothetical protein